MTEHNQQIENIVQFDLLGIIIAILMLLISFQVFRTGDYNEVMTNLQSTLVALEKQEHENSQLHAQNDAIIQNSNQIQLENVEYQESLEKVSAELAVLNNRVAEIEQQKKALQAERSEAMEEKQRIESELVDTNTLLASVREELDSTNSRLINAKKGVVKSVFDEWKQRTRELTNFDNRELTISRLTQIIDEKKPKSGELSGYQYNNDSELAQIKTDLIDYVLGWQSFHKGNASFALKEVARMEPVALSRLAQQRLNGNVNVIGKYETRRFLVNEVVNNKTRDYPYQDAKGYAKRSSMNSAYKYAFDKTNKGELLHNLYKQLFEDKKLALFASATFYAYLGQAPEALPFLLSEQYKVFGLLPRNRGFLANSQIITSTITDLKEVQRKNDRIGFFSDKSEFYTVTIEQHTEKTGDCQRILGTASGKDVCVSLSVKFPNGDSIKPEKLRLTSGMYRNRSSKDPGNLFQFLSQGSQQRDIKPTTALFEQDMLAIMGALNNIMIRIGSHVPDSTIARVRINYTEKGDQQIKLVKDFVEEIRLAFSSLELFGIEIAQ